MESKRKGLVKLPDLNFGVMEWGDMVLYSCFTNQFHRIKPTKLFHINFHSRAIFTRKIR